MRTTVAVWMLALADWLEHRAWRWICAHAPLSVYEREDAKRRTKYTINVLPLEAILGPLSNTHLASPTDPRDLLN